MSATGSQNQIVTQLIIDSSGAKVGSAEFAASMAKAKDAANDSGVAGTWPA
jgi:hypothetical protein